MLIRLREGVLTVANTGKPLTAQGLLALCTLRASAKRGAEDTIGRFGTGFAAVLAVTDAPSISSGGAVLTWSAAATRALLRDSPLSGELSLREGQVPVLRLPFAAAATHPPTGYDTEVRLPLRPDIDAASLLAGIDATLLLVLESLDEIVVEAPGFRRELRADRAADGSVTVDGLRWLRATAGAALPGALLAEAGPEAAAGEIRATAWWPADGWPQAVPRVLYAPTPTEEKLSVPALIVADVPLEAHRRRSLPGPLRSFALGVAADAIAALAEQLPGSTVLQLVPTGLPASQVDAELATLVLERLTRLWPLPGRRVLDLGRATPAVHAFLHRGDEPEIPDLLPAHWPVESPALRALGVERLETADVVALLSADAETRTVTWWADAWAVLAEAPDREALAALPVPLLGGGLAAGPRGLLCAREDPVPEGLAQRLQLRDPAAAHPLQLALGAIDAGPLELLAALRPEIAASYDEGDTELARPVLTLAATLRPGECGWLADLAVRDSHDEIAPAGELVLPGSPLDLALRDDAPLGVIAEQFVHEFGVPALLAAGVGSGLVEVRGDEAVADLDGGEEFLDAIADPGEEPVGVKDLEWLRWPAGLALLGDLSSAAVPYVRWWCAREPVFGGRLPREVLAEDADPLLAGLYDPAPAGIDPAVFALLGCRQLLPADADDVFDLLDRLGDSARDIDRQRLRSVLIHIAGLPEPVAGEPPAWVRAVDVGGAVVVVPRSSAVLVDSPDLLPLLGNRAIVPVPLGSARALSRWLGVALASSLGSFAVIAAKPLTVNDVDGAPTRVSWRVTGEQVFAEGPEGLGRARAWLAGQWDHRHAFIEAARGGPIDPLIRLESDLE